MTEKERQSKITVTEILSYASNIFDKIAEDLIAQTPLSNTTGIFGYQQVVVERFQRFLSEYPDLIAAKSNEIIEEFDIKINEQEIHTIREELVSLCREKITYYANEYFNKPLLGKS